MSRMLPNDTKSTAKRFSWSMVALPVALSPLLMSATGLPALGSIIETCSLEESASYPSEQLEGTNASYRRDGSIQGDVEADALDRTEAAEGRVNTFVRDRWTAVRRLIRENPYFKDATPEQQAQTEALCIAQIRADYEVRLAQAATSNQPQIPALPELGAVPSGPVNSPAPATINLEPTAEPIRAIRATPPVTRSEPAALPTAAPIPARMPAIDPATIQTAQDPGVYMGPQGEPTPFDGSVIRTLSDLPDGNYRYISGAAEERAYSNEELRQRGGSVFVLKKVGNNVTGDLLPRIGLPGICVTGTVSGDMITGAAYPYDTTDSLQDSARQIGENYEPHGSGALKIRRTRTEGNRLYYAGALLDLTAYTPINAGSSLPPTSCQIGRTGGRDQG